MNRTYRAVAALAAAAALAGLAGCTSNGSPAEAAPVTAPAATTAPVVDKAAALKIAIQGYNDALLAGAIGGAATYLHSECNDDDRGNFTLAAAQIVTMAKGAKVTIDSVIVDGGRGRVGDWHLSAGAPDALRRAMKESVAEQASSMPWRLVNGEWYFRPSTCTGGPR